MLEVKIENIIPVTEARDSFNQLVDSVEGSDDMFVLTKNGKPSAILVGVQHLEKLTGTSHEELLKEVEDAGDSVATPTTTETLDTSLEPLLTPTPDVPVDESVVNPTPAVPAEPAINLPPLPPVAPVVSPVVDTEMQNAQDSPFSYDSMSSPATPAAAPVEPAVDDANATTSSQPATSSPEDTFAMPSDPASDDQQAVTPEDAGTPLSTPTNAV